MSTWSQARPARALPVLAYWHTLKFKRWIDLNNAVDLTVWMFVILTGVHLLGVEVDTRQ